MSPPFGDYENPALEDDDDFDEEEEDEDYPMEY